MLDGALADMTLNEIRRAILQGEQISISPSSMNRFWFYPGKNIYEEDQGIILIKECPVILLTNQMYLTKSGQIIDVSDIDVLAQKFAEDFTKYYSAIAEKPNARA